MVASIPQSFELFLAGWNEWDADRRRTLFDQAVAPDVEFTDPLHQIHGLEAFLDMVADFQRTRPGAVTLRRSDIDLHHDCARYHWAIMIDGTKLIDGFDVVRLDAQRRFRQINGFFGLLTLNG
ncbi:MAG: nuclear transport factor 2 family protein [Sphingomonas sp.]|nr:nuclear transport factor 2 family protein [Sphingomonas sp.]